MDTLANVINNNRYIGSTKNIKRRFANHRYQLLHEKHFNYYLQKAWNKYGPAVFVFNVLVECETTERLEIEQNLLDKCQPEYNIKKTVYPPPVLGEDGLDRLSTATKKRKMAIPLSERKLWSEKCHKAKAEKWANETPDEKAARIERMSKPKRGIPKTEEHKRKISESRKRYLATKTPDEIQLLVDQMNSGKTNDCD